jgi:lipoprotein-anchoring transpeptidase ErfK/SrfK
MSRRTLLTLVAAVSLLPVGGVLLARPPATKKIVINIHRQKLFAYEGKKLVYEFDCITGRAGHETRPGVFRISRKVKHYTSKKYKAPMPFSMFFSADGKAIHQSPFARERSHAKYLGIGDPGSHGCVGLDEADARALFGWAPVGTRIEIVAR